MRVGICSDVHGNRHALDAVIEAIGDVDEYWFLGDAAAIGADPVGCVTKLRSLAPARAVRGNTDRYVVTWERPAPPKDESELEEFEKSFQWTSDRVNDAGCMPWLEGLSVEERVVLPDGTRVLLVHASPGTDEGRGFPPDQDETEAAQLLAGADADVVIVGHTHKAVDKLIDGVRVFNPGPVSNQHPGDDRRAAYAILEADERGHTIEHRRAEFDIDGAIEALWSSGFPGARFVANLLSER